MGNSVLCDGSYLVVYQRPSVFIDNGRNTNSTLVSLGNIWV